MKQQRQQPGRGAIDRAHAYCRGLLSAARAEFRRESIGLRQQGTGFPDQDGAIVGQCDAAGGARHQPRPEVFFEQTYEASQGRGQHIQPPRRLAEMQLFGRRHEASQLMKIHPLSPGEGLYHFFV